MPECSECGNDVKSTTWNAWNMWFLCEECKTKLEEESKCPYCRGIFTHLRASEYKKHMKICRELLDEQEDTIFPCPECGNDMGSPVFGEWGDAVSECSCGHRIID